jgi:hypothetical protein
VMRLSLPVRFTYGGYLCLAFVRPKSTKQQTSLDKVPQASST